jgi:hypothetical protein
MMTFNDDKKIAESFDDLTTIDIQQKKKVVYYTKLSTSTSVEKEYSSHRRQNSPNNKKKLIKAALIDASHPLPLEPPFTAPPSRMYVPVKKYYYINPFGNWS